MRALLAVGRFEVLIPAFLNQANESKLGRGDGIRKFGSPAFISHFVYKFYHSRGQLDSGKWDEYITIAWDVSGIREKHLKEAD